MYVPKTVYMKPHQICPPVPSQNMLPPGRKECNPVSLNLCFTNQYAPSVEVIWIFFQLLLCFLHLLWDVLCCLLRGKETTNVKPDYPEMCATLVPKRHFILVGHQGHASAHSYFGYITIT